MKIASKIKLFSLAIVVIVVGIVSGIEFIKQNARKPIALDKPYQLIVEPGQYAHYVINRLYEKRIIDHPVAFKLMLKLKPELAAIKTGTYRLTPDMTGLDLFEMLNSGNEVQFSISLVEGLTWKSWLLQLNNNEMLIKSELTDEQRLAILKPIPAEATLEGLLMPDTYYFTRNTSVDDVVVRAYQSMQVYLQQAWDARDLDLPYASPYEALIMASIIEKETGLAQERPRIAGVFVNRLRKNMRLGTDPTVIYGIGDKFDGDIRRKDLRTHTPYNTYLIKGLPPTPIAMPSKLAIEAALHPLDTDELYFVSKGDGSHYFSHTLKEHNQAVRKYQLNK